MKTPNRLNVLSALAGSLLAPGLLLAPSSLRAQATAFTYQGRLNDSGLAANRSYDFRFAIFDSTNLPGILVAGPVTNSAVVVTNGLFTVALDFGASPFSGPARWLDIAVRTNGGAFVSLSPRQALAPSPYAITAGNLVAGGLSSGTYSNPLTLNNPANVFAGSHSGNGSGLTGLNAAALTSGTVPDARLSTNVALLNAPNIFTATQTINGNLGLGTNAPTARLHVNGQVRITGGAPGAGKVLTGDSGGTAVWSAPRASPQVVVVDAAGNGDYTSISAALAAISPSPTSPFIVEVWPGLYFERVVMKSYVHLQGADPYSTVVMFNVAGVTNNSDFAVIKLNLLTNVSVCGFTLTSPAYTNPAALQAAVGIYDVGSSPVIANNRFVLLAGYQPTLAFPNPVLGVASANSSPDVHDCYFEEARSIDGVSLYQSSGSICGNTFSNHWHAATLTQSSAQILNNQMNGMGMAVLIDGSSGGTVAFNRIAGATGSTAIRNQGEARILGNQLTGPAQLGVDNVGEASILGNTLNGCTLDGIRSSGSVRTAICGNLLLNCGGAGEPALLLVNSSAVVSANTFLSNSFGDIQVGGTGTPVVYGNLTTGSVRGGATITGYGAATIATSTTSNLLFNAAGGIGVGTINPSGALHLVAPTGLPPAGLLAQDNGLVLGLQATSGYKWVQSYGGPLVFNPQGNNVGIGTTNPATAFDVSGTITCVSLNQTSDREAKEAFAPVDPAEILDKVATLPITSWQFKGDNQRHLGPMAQDFYAALNLGADPRHIATVDEGGVALAAIQALTRRLADQESELRQLKQSVAQLRALLRAEE
jgi:hypothetical protein